MTRLKKICQFLAKFLVDLKATENFMISYFVAFFLWNKEVPLTQKNQNSSYLKVWLLWYKIVLIEIKCARFFQALSSLKQQTMSSGLSCMFTNKYTAVRLFELSFFTHREINSTKRVQPRRSIKMHKKLTFTASHSVI